MWWYVYQFAAPIVIGVIAIAYVFMFGRFIIRVVHDKEYIKTTKPSWAVVRFTAAGLLIALLVGVEPFIRPTEPLPTQSRSIRKRDLAAPVNTERETLEERSRRLINEAERDRQKSKDDFNKLPNHPDR